VGDRDDNDDDDYRYERVWALRSGENEHLSSCQKTGAAP